MKLLPLRKDIETKRVLKKCISANRALSLLNGVANIIPNQLVLINSLILKEAKSSSEIENIITTNDELYKAEIDFEVSRETKEVQRYKQALFKGYELLKENNLLLIKHLIEIQSVIVNNNAGIRKQTGTQLKNSKGKVIYTPPQNYDEIMRYLINLEKYINDDSLEDYDYLVKMAIIHYQFEAIHPFYDGNGRTGRILNVLYLVYKELLNLPILYISDFIIKNKEEYYKYLANLHQDKYWEDYILFMLNAVEKTAIDTIETIKKINTLMNKQKQIIKQQLPKIYSKELIELLFINPYTKIEFLEKKLNITRQTASKYLKQLLAIGILQEHKKGKFKYYINTDFYSLLKET
ncbi:Fic/DOC family N-terminal domain-containing protein [Caminibacter profundus]